MASRVANNQSPDALASGSVENVTSAGVDAPHSVTPVPEADVAVSNSRGVDTDVGE
jgi:protein-tyrosine-phosphatase